MRILTILLILFAAIPALQAQNITILNAKTGQPVEGVLVTSDKSTTQSNAQGKVNLNVFSANEILNFQHASFLKYNSTKQKIINRGNIVLLIEDPVRLNEIVVSVNRWGQSKAEVPNKIKTISAEEVLHYNPQTTADLLGSKGGIFIQKSQMGGGSPMIRGFAANRVLLVVDGIRMNNAIYRSGNLQNVISIDANSTENAEIIFGPGSVIYGSDALGGVMSFTTLRPRLSTTSANIVTGKMMVRTASANFEKTIHGTFNFGTKKWAALLSSTFTDFDDLHMGSNGPKEYLRPEYVSQGSFDGTDKIIQNKNSKIQKYTAYNQFNMLGKIRFRPSEAIEINLSANHSQTSDIPRYDRLIVYRSNALRYGDWYYGPQKWSLFSGHFQYRKEFLLFDKLSLLSGYQLYTESRHDRGLNKADLRNRKENLDVFSVNLDFGKTIDKQNDFFYGFETYINKINSTGFTRNLLTGVRETIAPRYPNNSNYGSVAGYFSYKINLKDKFILQTGARYTHTWLNGTFDHRFYNFPFDGFNMKNAALNGNIGIVWHPTEEWQINMNAATGFRSPNIDDVAKVFDSEPGNVIVPNPTLKPEYARNIEIGIIRSYTSKARIEISGFYTRLKDAMVRRDFTLNAQDSILYDGILSQVEALVNADAADIYGGNFSFEYLFSTTIRTRNNLTVIRGKDSDGYPVRHAPPTFGSSHLIYEKQKWFVDLFVDYSGKLDYEQLAPSEKEKPYMYATDKNGHPYSPSWWTLNLESTYTMSKILTLSGGVENIFDKRYRTYSSGIVSPGINFVFSIRAKF